MLVAILNKVVVLRWMLVAILNKVVVEFQWMLVAILTKVLVESQWTRGTNNFLYVSFDGQKRITWVLVDRSHTRVL